MNKLMLGVAAGLTSLALSAETIVWTDVAAGETAEYGKDLEGANTLKIPAGTHNSVAAAQLYYANVDGAALTVDGAGATMNLPARTDGFEYADPVWGAFGLTSLAKLTRLAGTTATDAAFSAQNATFVVRSADGLSSLVFDGGSWSSPGYRLDLVSGTDKESLGGSVTLAGGTYELGELYFSGSTRADNDLTLKDGVNLTVGKFNALLTGSAIAHTNRLTISGAQTRVNVDTALVFSGASGSKRVAEVLVEDGAQLTVKRLEASSQQVSRFYVRNGARVSSYGANGTDMNYKMGFSTAGEDIGVVVDNAAWTMPVGTSYSASYGGWGDCTMHATNSTVTLNGQVRGVGEWHFDSCMITNFVFTLTACHGTHQSCIDALFKNCTILNPWQNYANMSVAGDPRTETGESRITFDGGTADMYTLGAGTKSAWASGNGRIVMKNGADVWTHGTQSAGSIIGTDGTGVVEVAGATWRMEYANNSTTFGKNAGSFGVLRIGKDGVFRDSSAAGGVTFGSAGDGRLEMNGGSFSTKTLTLASGAGTKGSAVLEDCELNVVSIIGGQGTSALSADGAKITCSAAGSALSNLGSVTVGAKGLEFSSDYATALAQDVAPEAGADATLTLSGSGDKTISGKITVPHLVVRGCRLIAAAGCDLSATTLELLDGATLAMADGQATTLALAGLVLGDETTYGTIEADVTDTIALTAEPEIGKGMVALAGAYGNDSYALLTCEAEISPATATAWSAAYLSGGRITGRMYSFETVKTDKTSFTVVVADAVPVTETARWTASGASADWDTAANWENGRKPDGAATATFDDASAAPEAVLDSVATVGAVSFDTADGTTVSGEGSIAIADTGMGSVAAKQGENVLDVPVVMPSETEFAVDEGAALTVNGALVNGAVNKTGKGKLVLANDANQFISGIKVNAGVVEASSAAALGYNAGVTLNSMFVGNASVRIGTTGEAENLGHPLTVEPGEGKVAEFILAGDAETRMTTDAFKSGLFLKRGAGTLSLVMPAGQITPLGREIEFPDVETDVVFPEDAPPSETTGLASFTVAEGGVYLKAAGPNARVQMKNNTGLSIGVSSRQIPENACPTLTLDGVSFDPPQQRGRLYICAGKYPPRKAVFACVNGAKSHFWTTSIGTGSHDYLVEPELVYDGGFCRWNGTDFSSTTLCKTRLTVKNGGIFGCDSAMGIGKGSLIGRFDNGSYMQGDGAATPQDINYTGSEGTSLDIAFENGSTAYLLKLVHKSDYANDMRLAFGGGSTWACGANDIDLSIRASENAHIEMLAGGMNLSVASGKTFATRTRFDGVGGLVKSGAGTLRFGRRATLDASGNATELDDVRTWCFTGTLSVQDGTVEVEDGAAAKDTSVSLAAGTFLDLQGGTATVGKVSGAGTVRNGAFDGTLTIGVTASLPTIAADCALPAKLAVDFGRTAADPIDLKGSYPVAKFAGLKSGTYNVRVSGTGLDGKYRGTLTVGADGTATVSDIGVSGLVILVR